MASKSLNAGAATFTPGEPNTGSNGDVGSGETNSTSPSSSSEPPHVRDSFQEYAEMVETIEEIMDEESDDGPLPDAVGATLAPPPIETGLPPHLANHAAEFWFPESRDCTCCGGFKFGCECARATNGGACKFCGNGASASPAPAATPSTASAPVPSPGPLSSQYGSHDNRVGGPSHGNNNYRPAPSAGRGYHPGGGGGGMGKRKVVCKFFLSPSGCRNGEACPFEHVNQAC